MQKIHYRLRCKRLNFLHKRVNELLDKYDVVVMEDINIDGMRRRPNKPRRDESESSKYLPNGATRKAGLNKSIADVGWRLFKEILQYKAEALGKLVVLVPPHNTSQVCSGCGELVKKSPSTRTHSCRRCGLVLDRDYNASLNILRLGLQSLGTQSLEAPRL